MKAFRLLIDGPTEGVWNMAIDEALLAAAYDAETVPVLRWYQWERPTLSLGYFQRWNHVPDSLTHLPRVRRSTGGGAILHDDELTYSLAFPAGTWPRKLASEIVADVHAAVAAVLEKLSKDVRERACSLIEEGEQARPRTGNTLEPFLCFDRRSPNDLVAGADKIMGSAQRRQGGRLLQHGSIRLRGLDPAALIADVTKKLAVQWHAEFTPSSLTNREESLAEESAVKHRAAEWTQRR